MFLLSLPASASSCSFIFRWSHCFHCFVFLQHYWRCVCVSPRMCVVCSYRSPGQSVRVLISPAPLSLSLSSIDQPIKHNVTTTNQKPDALLNPSKSSHAMLSCHLFQSNCKSVVARHCEIKRLMQSPCLMSQTGPRSPRLSK